MIIGMNWGGPATPGPRVREIGNWKLVPVPKGHRLREDEMYIRGITVKDGGVTLNFTRYTETSPIVHREGRTLITESGSRYTLLEPAEGQDPNGYLSIPE